MGLVVTFSSSGTRQFQNFAIAAPPMTSKPELLMFFFGKFSFFKPPNTMEDARTRKWRTRNIEMSKYLRLLSNNYRILLKLKFEK